MHCSLDISKFTTKIGQKSLIGVPNLKEIDPWKCYGSKIFEKECEENGTFLRMYILCMTSFKLNTYKVMYM